MTRHPPGVIVAPRLRSLRRNISWVLEGSRLAELTCWLVVHLTPAALVAGHATMMCLVPVLQPTRVLEDPSHQWSSHIDREARPDVCAVLSVIAHATRNSIAHTVRIANAHGVLTGREMKGGGQGIAKARPGTVLRGRQKGTQEHR